MAGNQFYPHNINGQNVFKAVRSVLLRATSGVDNSSAYVWFENQKQQVIDTLAHLSSSAQGSAVASYFQRPMGANFLADQVNMNFNILGLREESRMNTAAQIQNLNTQVRTYDLFGIVLVILRRYEQRATKS